jgi:hypothetical protein
MSGLGRGHSPQVPQPGASVVSQRAAEHGTDAQRRAAERVGLELGEQMQGAVTLRVDRFRAR